MKNIELLYVLDAADYTDNMPVRERQAVRGIVRDSGSVLLIEDKDSRLEAP